MLLIESVRMCVLMSENMFDIFFPYRRFSDVLKAVFSGNFNQDNLSAVRQKRQSKTLARYLKYLNASWCIIEREYIDKDFMEDYANYYSRCFYEYGKFCCRVHFFDFTMDEGIARKKLFGRMDESGLKGFHEVFLKSYLGFIVFRPLPVTVYGRVCLRPLADADSDDTRYLAVQNIDVNLWGIPLSVKTMPYQEQDTVVAACATSALWSAFQITGRKFRHCIPSPHRITNIATQGGVCEYRAFPNKGLALGDIGRSIFKVGLTQQDIHLSTPEHFLSEIYAYLRLGLPVILIGAIRYAGRSSDSDDWHAVTVCGFQKTNIKGSWREFVLEGSSLNKLYCHDDRIGPFTDLTLNQDNGLWKTKILEFQTNDNGDRIGGELKEWQSLSVQCAFVPLYHKIRIQLIDVRLQLQFFTNALSIWFRNGGSLGELEKEDGFVWDVYLTTDDMIKQSVRKNCFGTIADSDLENILRCDMPKYIWVVSAMQAGSRCVTFLVDATGIAQDIRVFLMISEDDNLKEIMKFVSCYPEMTLNPFARCIRES